MGQKRVEVRAGTGEVPKVIRIVGSENGHDFPLKDIESTFESVGHTVLAMEIALQGAKLDMSSPGTPSMCTRVPWAKGDRRFVEIRYEPKSPRMGKIYIAKHNLDTDMQVIILVGNVVQLMLIEEQRRQQEGIQIVGGKPPVGMPSNDGH